MLLYHFTSRACFAEIMRTSLFRGSVPHSPGRDANAVWLTSDPGPFGHGLESGGPMMTEDQRQQAFEWSAVMPPPGTRFPKEADVRIEVEIPHDHENLHQWFPWARRRLPPELMALLHPIGSDSLIKARTWYLYFGAIAPSQFLSVEEQPKTADRARLRASDGASRVSESGLQPAPRAF